ncbi:hypothetical protein NDU88_002858 [Pleurodeles waltl]|uniref:Uncharacterized protein n=1 Tax=Pleurodeles waltl TaxID=8319 RepID=A0AAV7NET2_PLEWA|nr:hypothetical protein NDU88_002858 [Pleurodeles waltl]
MVPYSRVMGGDFNYVVDLNLDRAHPSLRSTVASRLAAAGRLWDEQWDLVDCWQVFRWWQFLNLPGVTGKTNIAGNEGLPVVAILEPPRCNRKDKHSRKRRTTPLLPVSRVRLFFSSRTPEMLPVRVRRRSHGNMGTRKFVRCDAAEAPGRGRCGRGDPATLP